MVTQKPISSNVLQVLHLYYLIHPHIRDVEERQASCYPHFPVEECERVVCLWLHSMSKAGGAEYVMFAHCQSTLLSISPYSPYSLRCRPLGN